eukprot:5674303-Heterocapsa_arctica.AAC.1
MENVNIRVDEVFSQLRDAQTVINTIRATLALLGSDNNSTTTASALQIVSFNTMLSMGDTMNGLRDSIRLSNVRIANLEHHRSFQR